MKSASLEVLKTHVDVALGMWLSGGLGSAASMVGLNDPTLQRFFQGVIIHKCYKLLCIS